MKILIIEDEIELAQDIIKYLTHEQFMCECAADYLTAMEKINLHEYDCILLDLMLPGGNGISILQELKRKK